MARRHTKVNAFWDTEPFTSCPTRGSASRSSFPVGPAMDGPHRLAVASSLAGKWSVLVTLSGAQDFPPSDDQGFLASPIHFRFPHRRRHSRSTPLSELQTWRNTTNRLRHFDRLPRCPTGWSRWRCGVLVQSRLRPRDVGRVPRSHRPAHRTRTQRASSSDDRGMSARFQQRLAVTITQAWNAAVGRTMPYPGSRVILRPTGSCAIRIRPARGRARRDDVSVYERISATNQLVLTEIGSTNPTYGPQSSSDGVNWAHSWASMIPLPCCEQSSSPGRAGRGRCFSAYPSRDVLALVHHKHSEPSRARLDSWSAKRQKGCPPMQSCSMPARGRVRTGTCSPGQLRVGDFGELDKKYNRSHVCVRATAIPVEEARFDRIICNQVLEHVSAPSAVLPSCTVC